MSNLEGIIRDLDGRSMQLAEGVATADGTLEDGMIEIDFKLSTTGEDVTVEELVAAGSVFRIPKAGELALLGFVDGDRNEGYVLGWLPRPDASPADARVTAGALWLFPPDGEKVVVVSSSEIQLGSEQATSAVVLAPKLETRLGARSSAYGGHTHIVTAPLIPIGPVPSATPIPSTLPGGDISAVKTKAE